MSWVRFTVFDEPIRALVVVVMVGSPAVLEGDVAQPALLIARDPVEKCIAGMCAMGSARNGFLSAELGVVAS